MKMTFKIDTDQVFFRVLSVFLVMSCVGCQPDESHLVFEVEKPDGLTSEIVSLTATTREVDVSCGQCQFGMPGNGCDLAVRIDGQVYYVDGSSIDDHGDAHAEDGLCNCVRRGVVSGQVEAGRFVVSEMNLVGSSGLPDQTTPN